LCYNGHWSLLTLEILLKFASVQDMTASSESQQLDISIGPALNPIPTVPPQTILPNQLHHPSASHPSADSTSPLTYASFIGEETYSSGSTKQYLVTPAPTWIIDPLDGTVNYTHLFPLFCVSIALTLNHVPVIGIIHAPLLDVTYSACTGLGAWMNDSTISSPCPKPRRQLPFVRNPVPPLGKEAPKGCVFSCEWGKDRRDVEGGNMRRKVNSFMNMAAEIGGRDGKGGMVHGVRSLGR
jgi:hypothetical protein